MYFGEFCFFPTLPLSERFSAVLLGKKRAWIPDEKEAYIEIEIKELSGNKVIVETKDGRVRDHSSLQKENLKSRPPFIRSFIYVGLQHNPIMPFSCLPVSIRL